MHDNVLTEKSILNALEEKVDDHISSFEHFPKATQFKNMTPAVNLFIEHIRKGSRILLVHDSDCDGVNCYMISHIYFGTYMPGLNVELIITDRSKGYGFRPYHIEDRLNTSNRPDLIITSDNGITSHAGCEFARANGIDVIITDHHQVDIFEGIPSANFIVDPHQSDCDFPYPDINGSLVWWYFVNHFHQQMGGQGDLFYEFLPELCITVISDVMPVKHINRYIVKQGLKYWQHHHRQWPKSFYETLKKPFVTSEDLGFNLIPAINVTARLTNAEESAIFLTQSGREESLEWLMYLKDLNDTRKTKQAKLQATILKDYASWLEHPFIIIPGQNFEKGILGPVAGRIAELYKKPTVVLTLSKDGTTYSGSGRSVGEVNLLSLVKNNPYVIQNKTGGHKVAAGVSFPADKLNEFWAQLQEDTKLIPREQYNELSKDSLGYLNLVNVSVNLFLEMEKFQPFGKDFERPVFTTTAFLKSAVKMGKEKNHYRLIFVDDNGREIRSLYFFFSQELKRNSMVTFSFNIMEDTFNRDETAPICLHIKNILNIEKVEKVKK